MSKEIAWSHAAGFKFLIRCWHSKFCSSTNWSSGAWKKIGVWSAKKMASSSRPIVASSLAAGQISGSAVRSCWTVILDIEIFQQSVANDLVELQQCTDLLPEATWMGSRGPEASRESSVWCAWAAAAEPQRRNAVTCTEEMTKSAKCPPESATVRGSWGGMGCPRVRAIESNLAEGKRIWEFLAFEACPRPETHWNLSAESGDEILFL